MYYVFRKSLTADEKPRLDVHFIGVTLTVDDVLHKLIEMLPEESEVSEAHIIMPYATKYHVMKAYKVSNPKHDVSGIYEVRGFLEDNFTMDWLNPSLDEIKVLQSKEVFLF